MRRFVAIFCAVFLVLGDGTEAQRRGGGGGGGGGGRNLPPGLQGERPRADRTRAEALRALPVAQIWAELSFGMDIGDDKIAELKPILAAAYENRTAVLKEAHEEDTWAFAKGQLEKAERALMRDIGKVLSRRESRDLQRRIRRR